MEAINDIDIKPEVIMLRVGTHGLHLIRAIINSGARAPIIYVTEVLSSEMGLNAMRAGAYDFILTPCKQYEFGFTIERALSFMAFMAAESSQEPSAAPDPDTATLVERTSELTPQQQEKLESMSMKAGQSHSRLRAG